MCCVWSCPAAGVASLNVWKAGQGLLAKSSHALLSRRLCRKVAGTVQVLLAYEAVMKTDRSVSSQCVLCRCAMTRRSRTVALAAALLWVAAQPIAASPPAYQETNPLVNRYLVDGCITVCGVDPTDCSASAANIAALQYCNTYSGNIGYSGASANRESLPGRGHTTMKWNSCASQWALCTDECGIHISSISCSG